MFDDDGVTMVGGGRGGIDFIVFRRHDDDDDDENEHLLLLLLLLMGASGAGSSGAKSVIMPARYNRFVRVVAMVVRPRVCVCVCVQKSHTHARTAHNTYFIVLYDIYFIVETFHGTGSITLNISPRPTTAERVPPARLVRR